jgi:hypothetical protein
MAMIVRIIWPFFGERSAASGNSSWRFVGVTVEHEQDYEFELEAQNVDPKILLPDLGIIRIVEALGVRRDEACDWPAFEKMPLKFVSYTPRSG